MCHNCFYSEWDRSSTLEGECYLCTRNPVNVTKRFIPIDYRGKHWDHPIDMFISREHMELIQREIKERELKRKDPLDCSFPDPMFGKWKEYWETQI